MRPRRGQHRLYMGAVHVQLESRNGVVQTLSYNTAGQLASVVDSFGHSLTFTYFTWGGINSITVNGGAALKYAYGDWLVLSKVTQLDGTTKSYQYTDPNHRTSLTGFVDEHGMALGRPVGVAVDRTGALLVADDVGNTVWRVTGEVRPGK